MKKNRLLFLLLFIFGFVYSSSLVAGIITSKGTHPGTVSTAGVASNGAAWTTGSTWVGENPPGPTDDVVIASGDLVYSGTAAISVGSLTVKDGATFLYQTTSPLVITGTGTFTLEDNSKWYQAGGLQALPSGFATYTIGTNSNQYLTTVSSSTLCNSLPAKYGNLYVYKQSAILMGSTSFTDMYIQGNLTLQNGSFTSALKGSNNKSAQVTTIHVGGYVKIISGILTGVDAPTDWTATNSDGQTCTWEIAGDVTVGDASISNMAGLMPVSAADGGLRRTGIFNIGGSLSYLNGAKFYAGTSSSSTNPLESAIINLKGNLSTEASVVTASNTLGSFQVNFNGAASNQTLTLGAPTTQMSFSCTTTLGINKSSGGVQLGSDLTIGGHVTLTLTKGNLIIPSLSSYVVSLAGSGAISLPGGTPGYVETDGTGGLKLNVASSPISFPVGSTSYTPVVLTNSGTADNFTVSVTNTSNAAAVMKEWTITEAASGANVNVKLQWNTADENGTFVRANSIVSRWNGSAWDQTAVTTFTDLGGGIYTASAPGFSFAASTPSLFMVGNAGAMPVELSTFTSKMNGRNIQLNWETKTEVNFNKFEIDRALVSTKDAIVTWVSVGVVQASGSSNSPKKYSYTEKNLQSGKYQYRLKMIDNDGSFSFSTVQTAEVAIPKDFALSQNYPNPFNPITKIDYQVPVDAKVIMEVYNIAGQKVIELVNQDQSAGYYTVDFGSSKLSSGVYIYRLAAINKATGNNFSSIKKMILLK